MGFLSGFSKVGFVENYGLTVCHRSICFINLGHYIILSYENDDILLISACWSDNCTASGQKIGRRVGGSHVSELLIFSFKGSYINHVDSWGGGGVGQMTIL